MKIQNSASGNLVVRLGVALCATLSLLPGRLLAQSCASPPSGLISWWAGETNTIDAISGNNGTLMNGAGFGPGMVGAGFRLDGVSQYVEIPNNPTLNPQGSFTIEAWILPLQDAEQSILCKWGDADVYSNMRSFNFSTIPGRGMRFAIADTANQWNGSFHLFDVTNVITVGAWSHVAAVYDQSTGTRLIYVNGVKVAQRTDLPAITVLNSITPVSIGVQESSPTLRHIYFDGAIDEVSLYSRALSAAEIQAIYNAGSAGKCQLQVGPTIVRQPQSQTVNPGASVTFSVVAAGPAPLSYQWQLNNNPIPGATTTSWSLTGVQPSDAGTYSVVVTNLYGSVSSSNAVLTVNAFPPTLTLQPVSRAVAAGTTVTFTATAAGSTPLSYQWQFNGTNLPGATRTALTLTSVQPANAGNYAVAVTNQWGFTSSSNAVLTVLTYPPAITSQPIGATVNAGASVTLAVGASGTAPLVYQWQLGGANIAGATKTSLTLTSVTPANSGNYRAVVTNAYGSATSAVATLTVNGVPPTVSVQPQSQAVFIGGGALFTAVASGTAPLTYQWQFAGANIAGATATTLALTNAQFADSGAYDVIVANAYGAATSSVAMLSVTVPSCTTISNILSWWSAEGHARDIVGTNNGTLIGGAGFTNGEVGSAFSFNGTSQYVELPNNASLNPQGSLSFEAWIFPLQDAEQAIITKWGDTDAYSNMRSYNFSTIPGRGIRFAIADVANQWNGSFQLFDVTGVLTINAWNHVAAVYNQATGTRQMYVNGSKVGERTDAPITITTGITPVSIGVLENSPTSRQILFKGRIDEVSMYLRALTGAEIATIFNAGAYGKCQPSIPPAISIQPVGQSVFAGATVTLGVGATGATPLGYQWELNGADLAGATSSTLTIANAQPVNSGDYQAVVTNAYGSVTSAVANVTVTGLAPTLSSQPLSQSAFVGANVVLSAGASGTAPLAYQWRENSSAIAGATAPSLTLTNIQLSDAGSYDLLVTNVYGSVTSSVAVVTVNARTCTSVSNIVGWWAAEGNPLDSIGGNSGTIFGGAGFVSGEAGLAFSFNGTNQYVELPNNPGMTPQGSFTFEGWIYPLQDAEQAILTKWGDSDAYSNMRSYNFSTIPGRGLRLAIADVANQWNGSFQLFDVPGVLTIGVWNHVAGIYNQTTGTRQLYVNGVKVGERTDSPITIATGIAPPAIGILENSPTSRQIPFKGRIDELSMYSRALAGAEVQAIYNAGYLGKCQAPIAPSIMTQPQSQTVNAGVGTSFSLLAAGAQPLSYQWYFQGTNAINGGTNAVLAFASVQESDGGSYSAVVANTYGSVTSAVAVLTVIPPPSLVIASSATATAAVVTIPINLVARGTENALGFSLNFDPSKLSFDSIVLGNGATNGGSLVFNANQAAGGHVGVAISLPFGAAFAPGTQEVAEVSFAVTPPANANTTSISFGDTPTTRQISSASATVLPAAYSSATVTIPLLGIEGDVAPRGNPDGVVTIVDWVQIGRFIAGLDAVTNADEYQRADCAPRATLGNGELSIADWVQAGRYAAGLDAPTILGGPTQDAGPGPGVLKSGSQSSMGKNDLSRALRALGANALPGQTVVVPVRLDAQGNENAAGFSLFFDPTLLNLTTVSLGADAAHANLNVNTNTAGKLGIALALPTGSYFTAGSQEIARLSFKVASAGSAVARVSFTNKPIAEEVVDPSANSLTTAYFDASLVIGLPTAPIVRSTIAAGNLTLSWPVAASSYRLLSSPSLLSPTWTAVSGPMATNATEVTITLPLADPERYYRLVLP